MKENFDSMFLQEVKQISTHPLFNNRKPRLLLHACCAPCSSAILEQIASVFDISIYYYNPNIHPQKEYTRRYTELVDFLLETKKRNTFYDNDVNLIQAVYEPTDYFNAVETELYPERKTEGERGERCRLCYGLRLQKTAQYANMHSFDYFTTSLSISPHKDSAAINAIGRELEKTGNCKFLYADFKKRNGYKRSLELSKDFSLYRQDYCGCVFSMRKDSN